MADYTDAEKQQMRSAAFGAVFLVSKSDPGMLDTIKESFAASKSIKQASGDMQNIFKGGGMPKIPKGNQSDMEKTVLADLQSSVAAISAKDPSDLDSYRRVVLDACNSAAQASGGVSQNEGAVISKVMNAMGMQSSS